MQDTTGSSVFHKVVRFEIFGYFASITTFLVKENIENTHLMYFIITIWPYVDFTYNIYPYF